MSPRAPGTRRGAAAGTSGSGAPAPVAVVNGETDTTARGASPPASAPAPTALMGQYLAVKQRHPDAILFFRLGDFYEMFYEDAVYVAGALGLTLTTRDKGKEDPVPMCGVPHHAVRGYLAKLTDLGHRIAICEQLEDPRSVRGIVKRDVVRIVTPGVILDEESLDPRAPSHVAAAVGDARRGYGLAFLDVTTGNFRATETATREDLMDELGRAEARELVLVRDATELGAEARRVFPRLAQSPRAAVSAEAGVRLLADNLPAEGWDPALPSRMPLAAEAAALVLAYARATQPTAPLPLVRLETFTRGETLVIDEQARAHLELTETLLERKRTGALLSVLDQTRSAMGGRLLRRWLLFPLVALAPIRRRQDAVERLVGAHGARDAARRVLAEVGDVERLVGRARLGVASPRDLVALGNSLAQLPALADALRDAAAGELGLSAPAPPTEPRSPAMGTARAAGIAEDDPGDLGTDLGADLAARITATLRADAPASTKEGGLIRPGVSGELDELQAVSAGGRERLAAIEARERERTGIATLRIKFNSVFGYYIEVTRAQLERVPADYVRKQTVANAERFVTPELAEYESKILTADDRRIALETALFTALRDEIGAAAERLLRIAFRVAQADALASLAEVAHRNGYSRPVVDDSRVLEIEDGRHPVVEQLSAAGSFVPNDVRLDPDAEQILIVTGPNMAGKSTVIRQVALIVILAQMGAFVPARRARVGLCDRVFTRVGAGDNLARGESTFLVEMKETAHILRYAGPRSLVVLDEIGRGTSTYDGVSIAWAVAEHLHDHVGARTMFATHYHELCDLAESHPRVRNVSVAAREWKGEVVFLRKLLPGGASRSFGVEVAKLAGLPPAVVERARGLLRALEGNGAGPIGERPRSAHPGDDAAPQLALFNAPTGVTAPPARQESPEVSGAVTEIVATIRGLSPDDLTPRQALDLLADLKKKLTSGT